MTPEEKQSGIPCVLVGTDGNIYALLGRARQALRRGGRPDLVEPMTKEVLASKSYEEAIGHICEYVEFCKSRRLTGRLFSHSLPLVAPIRLSMPPAGFRGDCIIATRAVSGQLTAFFISESGELCPLYFSADFRIIFTICTCIGFFPCCRKKLHFSCNLDLQFFILPML